MRPRPEKKFKTNPLTCTCMLHRIVTAKEKTAFSRVNLSVVWTGRSKVSRTSLCGRGLPYSPRTKWRRKSASPSFAKSKRVYFLQLSVMRENFFGLRGHETGLCIGQQARESGCPRPSKARRAHRRPLRLVTNGRGWVSYVTRPQPAGDPRRDAQPRGLRRIK
jgi:hypothetical protein